MQISNINNSGNIQFRVGSTEDLVASLSATGAALFQNSANSTTAFQIQNSGGTPLFNIDTSNNDLELASAMEVIWGGDTNLYRSGAGQLSLGQEDDLLAFNAAGDSISFGADNDSAYIYGSNDLAGDWLLAGNVSGDANERVILRSDGTLNWGDGTAVPDTNLYRAGASYLATDGGLVVNDGDDAGLVALYVDGTDATIEVGDGTNLSYIDTAGMWSDQAAAGILF